MKLESYKNLIVWKKAMQLVFAIYRMTEIFPPEEKYGLCLQMRRSAISIPSNIAEGSRRGTRKDFRHFLLNAFGSGSELETQIIILRGLPFGKTIIYNEIDNLLNEVMRMLNVLIKKLDP